jgi:kinesin family protein C2/C3
VFGPDSTQEGVFKETEGLVQSVMDGYNVCIFAYGQTGSGKTFTMEGSDESPGLYYRSLQRLFDIIKEKEGEMTFELSVSMLEIYNESIADMLQPRSKTADIKYDIRRGEHGMMVTNLTMEPVSRYEDVVGLMHRGKSNRTTFATDMNEHSSRSHAMLSVYVTAKNHISGAVARGKLHLVDLAGSERVSKSGATGQRLKEAQNINKSLSALGDVIQARAAKRGHVPYRNSTLTYLLQDSLGGDSKTLMFVNMSPVSYNTDETFCSLNFAARVRNVELGKASKNVSQGGGGGR